MNVDKWECIAENLQKARKKCGYSYQQLADKTGLSKSTLQRYESGAIRNLSLGKAEQLAQALNITPAELLGWQDLNQYKELGDFDRLRELAQADREGRCVVLSTPMRPMICKPNDTDVYCPRCGATLSGGWPESDYDDYRKMVQCPNCGESIDDNKCEPESALKGVNKNGMDQR